MFFFFSAFYSEHSLWEFLHLVLSQQTSMTTALVVETFFVPLHVTSSVLLVVVNGSFAIFTTPVPQQNVLPEAVLWMFMVVVIVVGFVEGLRFVLGNALLG